MKSRTHAAPGAAALLSTLLLLASGCAPGIAARWDGTGERFEARYFQMVLDLDGDTPSAAWLDPRGAQTRLAVCGLREQDGAVEFRMDPDSPGAACDASPGALLFRGAFGRDVLAGEVLDGRGAVVGRFRAFRAGK